MLTGEQQPGSTSIRGAFDARMIAVASVTVMGSFMSILDTTIVNIALPSFVKFFHTSLANAQWVSTGYTLALAIVVPLTRWAADRYGTKRVWLASIAMFMLGSLFCGLSWSLPTLVISRLIQGIGGGMIMPTGQTILAREAGPNRLGRVMTVVGVPAFIAPLFGPMVGGLIIASLGWRWIFFINLPIGVLALIRGRRILERGDMAESRKIDLLGLLLLSPGLGLTVYGISEFGNDGVINALDGLTFLGGLVLMALFVLRSLNTAEPLLDLRLWRHRVFASATTIIFFFSAGLQSAVLLVQLYYQLARGYSPLHAALLTAPSALGAMIALPSAGTIMDRRGARRIVPFGILITGLSVIPFTQLTATTNVVFLSCFWFLRGIGTATTGTPTNASAYATLDRHEIPGATTINNIAQRVGNSFGVAIAAVILQRRIADTFHGGSVGALANLSSSGRAIDAVRLAIDFRTVFWFSVILVLVALLPVYKLPYRRLGGPSEHGADLEM